MKRTFTKAMQTLLPLCLAFFLSQTIIAQTAFFTEDFADPTLAGWTTEEVVGNGNPTSLWMHTLMGAQGNFPTAAIASTTGANGWVIFDSDYDCQITPNFGDQDSWLISPLVDATTIDEVFLRFEVFYRSFNDRPAIRVGTDLNDLSTWEDIEMFPGIVANDFGGVADGSVNPVTVAYDLTEFAANTQFYFAFQFLSTAATTNNGNGPPGCAYSINIDDVELLDGNPLPKFDMRVNSFYSRPVNYATPKDQVQEVGFLADIENVGAATQDGVNLTINIEDAGTMTSVYSETLAYGDIISDSLAENQIFPGTWTPPSEVAQYTGTYEVQGDSTDLVPFNNTQVFDFIVTDSVFAKENGVTTGGLRYNVFDANNADSGDDSYMLGNHYYMPNGGDYELAGVTFGLAYGGAPAGTTDSASVEGRFINLYLYKVETLSDSITDGERTSVAFASYSITGGDEGGLITVPAESFTNFLSPGSPITLEDNTHYLIMGQVVHPTPGTGAFVFWQVNENYVYSATILRQDQLGDVLNYGSFLGTGATATDGAFEALAGSDDSPAVLHLGIKEPSVIISTEDVLADNNEVNLFPNPVSEMVNLEIKLVKEVNNLTVEIVDVTGRMVFNNNFGSLQEETLNIDVNTLTNGTYFLTVKSALGSRTERFVIQK
ncbi:MAG: T9SS type A sorting domain-containing protein [Saprospiraceae bacterium]